MDTVEGVAAHGAQPLMLLVGAAVLWSLELWSRVAQDAAGTPNAWSHTAACGKVLRSLSCEAAALAACALLAGTLLCGGGPAMTFADPADAEAWNRITAAWPLLTTADSLIALQAMLRLLPLLSALLRPSESSKVNFATGSLPPALALAAAVCRVVLLLRSPYHRLDGPLGGWFHIAFEVAAIPPLLILSRHVMHQLQCVAAWFAVIGCAAWLSSYHRLALSDDSPVLDSAFTLAELLELAAAATFLARSLKMNGGPRGIASGVMHAVLPLQQGLSMYYLLVAFQDDAGLVGAGSPLAVMQRSSTAQVGMYLFAAAMHATLCLDDPKDV